jgi:hypothetical protein
MRLRVAVLRVVGAMSAIAQTASTDDSGKAVIVFSSRTKLASQVQTGCRHSLAGLRTQFALNSHKSPPSPENHSKPGGPLQTMDTDDRTRPNLAITIHSRLPPGTLASLLAGVNVLPMKASRGGTLTAGQGPL